MASFTDFIQSIRTDGNDGKAFEVFSKWFLKNDPEWSSQVDEVWLWDEWPDKWGPDCGIDLVFRHKNGETWAVQSKCYDSNYPVTKIAWGSASPFFLRIDPAEILLFYKTQGMLGFYC